MSELPETWRPVLGYENYYEVSNRGGVRSLGREGMYAGRWGTARLKLPAHVKKLHRSRHGYMQTGLTIPNRPQSTQLVHRLVMRAFVGVAPEGMEVNHIDGDKTNNQLSNLEYITSQQNQLHCTRVLKKKIGSANKSAKITAADVPKIRADQRTLKDIAADYGVSLQAIHHVKTRKNWAHIP